LTSAKNTHTNLQTKRTLKSSSVHIHIDLWLVTVDRHDRVSSTYILEERFEGRKRRLINKKEERTEKNRSEFFKPNKNKSGIEDRSIREEVRLFRDIQREMRWEPSKIVFGRAIK
jgi:hypothetical protein